MKLRDYQIAFVAPAIAVLSYLPAQAQSFAGTKEKAAAETPAHDAPVRRETLSGIDLYPEEKSDNGFLLSFQQELAEDGVLQFTNASGKLLYAKALAAGDHTLDQPTNVGKLRAGIYHVEVKTPTTVYWKKVRVRL